MQERQEAALNVERDAVTDRVIQDMADAEALNSEDVRNQEAWSIHEANTKET